MLLYVDAESDKKRRKYNNSIAPQGQEKGSKINNTQIERFFFDCLDGYKIYLFGNKFNTVAVINAAARGRATSSKSNFG